MTADVCAYYATGFQGPMRGIVDGGFVSDMGRIKRQEMNGVLRMKRTSIWPRSGVDPALALVMLWSCGT